MNPVEEMVNSAIDKIYGRAQKLIEKHGTRREKSSKDLLEFFEVKKGSISDLFRSNERLTQIETNNAMICFSPFVNENGRIVEEMTYSEVTGEKLPPVQKSVQMENGRSFKVLDDATVFFVWKGEKYCMEIEERRWSETNEYYFTLAAKSQDSLDRIVETFKAYRKRNHYLRGQKFNGASGKILPLSEHDWSDLVWPNDMKENLRSEIEVVFKNASLFNQYGLNSKKGFILAGEPGNGKTLLLKIVAKEINATCILIPFDEFKLTPYLFSLARDLAPTILILEDIDLFGSDRDDAANNVELGKLMNQLDGMVENREIIVIATTNRLEKVEKALQNRPGRFDRVYVIPNPDFQTRIKLISHYIGKIPNEITTEHIEIFAEEFAGYSSAYMKELVNSGFAQAILRDGQNPTLKFCDLESVVEGLKRKNGKAPVGFVVPELSKERSQF